MRALARATRFLNGIQGRRKDLVLISEGVDYNIFDVFERPFAAGITYEVREAIAEATRSNTSIYAIDPRGLDSPVADADVYELPDDLQLGFDNPYNRLLLSQTSLHVLAEETNGFAAVNTNDFDGMLERIVRENSTYYLLGYDSTNDALDGRFREIEVRLADPTLRVRARRGYVAPRSDEPPVVPADAVPGTSEGLRRALSAPISIAGLDLETTALSFADAGDAVSVAVVVEVAGAGLTFAQRDARWADTLELSLVVVDPAGRIVEGDRQDAAMNLQDGTYRAVMATGVRFVARLAVPPGRYQLRVGVREAGTEALGTTVSDLEVPDLRAAPLTLSEVAVASVSTAGMPTVAPDERLGEALLVQPTTARRFAASDVVAIFAEVYDNEAATPHTVEIATTLRRRDDGRLVFQAIDERSTDELGGAAGAYGHRALIPLSQVGPGAYVLGLEARSHLHPDLDASRRIGLTVAPDAP